MDNIYVLQIKKDKETSISVGAIGEFTFPEGWYGYVGSSRTEDFKRVDRHVELSDGEKDTKHWHIDYLLNEQDTEVIGYFRSESASECDVAGGINLDKIEGFGSSDCDCSSHLVYSEEMEVLTDNVRNSFEQFQSFGYDEIKN